MRKRRDDDMENRIMDEDDFDYETAPRTTRPVQAQVQTHYTKPSTKAATPCRLSHPVLSMGGGKVRGGSCFYPPKGCDIYVGLDRGMERHDSYPWEAGPHPIDICYQITDMSAPPKPALFHQLIQYLKEELGKGKQVAIGCLGGHGRTGTVIAALHASISGDKDAIKWVRENYCKKAVESRAQVDFLMKHYGVNREEGTKEYSAPWSESTGTGKTVFLPTLPSVPREEIYEGHVKPDPRATWMMLWGPNVRLTNG